jgi:hypothetical protein
LHKHRTLRSALDQPVMPQNFIACDRDQELLLPPNLRDWLPEDHFARFVLAAVEEMNLDAFYATYEPTATAARRTTRR